MMSKPLRSCFGFGDYTFKGEGSFSIDQRALVDIRKYLRVITALHVVFVSVFVLCFGLGWWRISTLDLTKASNLNAINANIRAILDSVQSASTLAVPIVGNAQFMTNGLAAALAGALNSSDVAQTASAARAAGTTLGRHLTQEKPPISAEDLVEEDYKFRRMTYRQVHSLLEKTNTFNVTAMNSLISGAGEALHWIAAGINYTSVLRVYEQVRYDVETSGRFVSLLTMMSGVAASALNVTTLNPLKVLDAYKGQLAAAGLMLA
jgi:hypothetical protein